jgi:hypothetical protein
VTGNCRPEAEQLVASAAGAEEATSNTERGEGGCHPTRRLELSVGTGGSGDNTANDLTETVKFTQCERDSGMKGFRHPTSDGPLVDTNQIPSAAGKGARSISGLEAAADKCTAIDAGELGMRVQ